MLQVELAKQSELQSDIKDNVLYDVSDLQWENITCTSGYTINSKGQEQLDKRESQELHS